MLLYIKSHFETLIKTEVEKHQCNCWFDGKFFITVCARGVTNTLRSLGVGEGGGAGRVCAVGVLVMEQAGTG